MKRVLLYFMLIFLSVISFAQNTEVVKDTLRKDALNVFMTPSEYGNLDYVKKEIPYVNYVRDIREADLYILSNYQRTGSGGKEYTFFLVGQHGYAGMKDTLTYVTAPDETEEGRRQKEIRTLKIGLMRYVAKTPLSKFMNITFTEPLSETVSTDKWDSWVFRTSMNGFLNGQKTYRSNMLFGNFSASRVTNNWKINLGADYSYSIDVFEFDSGTLKSSNNSKSLEGLVVKSISDHWSYGGSVEIGSSSFRNQKMEFEIMPGIEYDIYPYSESTKHQLRLLYRIGFSHVNYIDTTIYDKMKENLWLHSLSAAFQVVQKWGSVNLNCSYSNYFFDWSKNNISLNGNIELRIAKGLSVQIGGGASIIHDQLGLAKKGASTEEVLLRRRELATQFEYFTSFGFSYTFGSIYNNVVNPRFGNRGGGMTIIIN